MGSGGPGSNSNQGVVQTNGTNSTTGSANSNSDKTMTQNNRNSPSSRRQPPRLVRNKEQPFKARTPRRKLVPSADLASVLVIPLTAFRSARRALAPARGESNQVMLKARGLWLLPGLSWSRLALSPITATNDFPLHRCTGLAPPALLRPAQSALIFFQKRSSNASAELVGFSPYVGTP